MWVSCDIKWMWVTCGMKLYDMLRGRHIVHHGHLSSWHPHSFLWLLNPSHGFFKGVSNLIQPKYISSLSLQFFSSPLMHLTIHYFIQYITTDHLLFSHFKRNGSVIITGIWHQKLEIIYDFFLKLNSTIVQLNTNPCQLHLLYFSQICCHILTRTILVKTTITSCQDYNNNLFCPFRFAFLWTPLHTSAKEVS